MYFVSEENELIDIRCVAPFVDEIVVSLGGFEAHVHKFVFYF